MPLPIWFESLATTLDPTPPAHPTAERFARNPARAGLLAGGLLGIVNAVASLVCLVLIAPEAASFSLYAVGINTGLFVGAFVGGVAGLYCQWRELGRGHLRAILAIVQVIYAGFVALGFGLQFLGPG